MSTNTDELNRVHKYGFTFGSMNVTRTSSDEKASIISVTTPKSKFSVRATKTGQVRFYDEQGNECELVAKSHIEYLESYRTPFK